ncbi:MAG TPA: TIM barrel protein [Acidisarcina sp.]|nr:TIM barrel protein [Acidisarcina sp.]
MTEYSDALELAMNQFAIEVPSWGFANTGTRFGKYLQTTAATTLEEKFADASQVHIFTGKCPTMALHVEWDLPQGTSISSVLELSAKYDVGPGSINPNLFQRQAYKHGSLCNERPEIRAEALEHILYSIDLAAALASRDISLWFADGSNYPGMSNIRKRKQWMEEGLRQAHEHLHPGQRMLVEYKPFEPAFYHTDIADWGMSLLHARHAGPQAKVLVDVGHHYLSQNIEQIVAWLLSENMLGGFHFNDRRYADDDLTLGSIDPYQVFRIFAEIAHFEWETNTRADIAYMIDQSHNVKNKIEAMIQTVTTAQELYAKAALLNHEALEYHREHQEIIDAENVYKDAFATDVRPFLKDWRRARGLPEDPLKAFRASGYLQEVARQRQGRQGETAAYA